MKMEQRDLKMPKDRRDATTSQGTPAAARNQKSKEQILSQSLQGSTTLLVTDFSPLIPILNYWSPELRQNKLLSHSHKKLIHSTPSLLASESSAHSLLSSQKESFSKFCHLPYPLLSWSAQAAIKNTTGQGLKQQEFISESLVTKSPRSRCQQGWVLEKAFSSKFQTVNFLSLQVGFPQYMQVGVGGGRTSSLVLLPLF